MVSEVDSVRAVYTFDEWNDSWKSASGMDGQAQADCFADVCKEERLLPRFRRTAHFARNVISAVKYNTFDRLLSYKYTPAYALGAVALGVITVTMGHLPDNDAPADEYAPAMSAVGYAKNPLDSRVASTSALADIATIQITPEESPKTAVEIISESLGIKEQEVTDYAWSIIEKESAAAVGQNGPTLYSLWFSGQIVKGEQRQSEAPLSIRDANNTPEFDPDKVAELFVARYGQIWQTVPVN